METGKKKPLHKEMPYTLGQLDKNKPCKYRDRMSMPTVPFEMYVDLLRFVDSNLAVKFSEVSKRFEAADPDELRGTIDGMAKEGLLKIHPLAGESEDAVLSITADGSKKADSVARHSLTAIVGA
jgi:hypothetical protein